MAKDTSSSWQASIVDSYDTFITQVINAAPQLLGAFAVLLLGWFVAQLLRMATRRLVRGLDSLWSTGDVDSAAELRSSVPRLPGDRTVSNASQKRPTAGSIW